MAQADGFGARLPATSPSPKAQDPVPPAKAQDPESCKHTSTATTEGQRLSWSAIRRYYSKANSFPDYGPAQPDMGPERLRQMNQSWGSVNTLTKSGSKREFPESPSVPHQVLAKRQRREANIKDSLSPESVHQTSLSNSRSTFINRSHATRSGSARASHFKLDTSVDIYDPDPEPSSVTSDIVPRLRGSKRYGASAPALSKQTANHHRIPPELDEIETSEDELQSNHSTMASNIRQTNFSQITSSPQPRPRSRMRGDITPTSFRENVSRNFTKPPMAILKAVSGKEMYHSAGINHHHLYLHGSPSKPSLLEAWSDGKPDEEHQWVSFDVNNVSNLRFGGCYLSFRRSMMRGRPPTITLQFENAEGAAQAARLIDASAAEGQTREEMKRILDVAWKNAAQSARHLSHDADAQRLHVARGGRERYEDTPKHPKALERGSKRLRDKMTTRPDHVEEKRRSRSPVRRIGMETRRTRRLPPTRKETPPVFERWSKKNTSWEQDWNHTLVYPATGRNRASVDKEDIVRLDEGEFLNDNLISFYMRYLQTNMERERPELFKRVYIFSTFFFEKLTSQKGGISYDGVKSWTSKLDLFSYDYIVVPVNENAHWYLAVICNIPKLLEPVEDDSPLDDPSTDALRRPLAESPIMTNVEREMCDISLEDVTAKRRSSRQLSYSRLLSSGSASSPAKTDPATSSPATAAQGRAPSRRSDASQARIITLDSLGSTHSATCKALKDYLVEEARDKKNVDLVTLPAGMKARGIPEQNNFCDCGVFLLNYIEEFLKDPDELVRKILSKDKVDWSIDAARLREKVRNILFSLQQEQTDRLTQEREAKRHQKRMSQSSISSTLGTVSDVSPKSVSSSKREQPSTPRPPQQVLPVSSPTMCRSVTPPVFCRATPDTTADDGFVDIVRLPPEAQLVNETDPSTPQASPKPSNPQHARLIPDSPPPSSSIDETNTHDAQDSVQLLSVVTRPQTPQTSQTRTALLYSASHS